MTNSPTYDRGLSSREMDVLRAVACGLTTEEAAAQLQMGASTVQTYLRSASEKLYARNRTHAVARAYDLGLLGRQAEVDRG